MDYLLRATISNIANGDTITFDMIPSGVVATGEVSGQSLTVSGSTTSITHTRSSVSAAISSTSPASLTESNLNTATVTVTLAGTTYDASLLTTDFTLNGAPTGTTINSVVRDSDTQATLTLDFNGTDFDTNASMSVTVATVGLVSGGPLTTATVTVTAVVEVPDLQQLRYRWRNDNGGESGGTWYNPAWTYRKKITVDLMTAGRVELPGTTPPGPTARRSRSTIPRWMQPSAISPSMWTCPL
jgi:hypothetical protein